MDDWSHLYDHTFAIVGRCVRTGALGVCVQTRSIAVGSRCPWAKSHVGALSTQSLTNTRFGPLALQLMEAGYTAPKVLQELEASDLFIERRQIGIVDRDGHSAVQTGSQTMPWAGQLNGKNYAAVGNGLVGPEVLEAMVKTFLDSEKKELEERLLESIEAGQAAGGQEPPPERRKLRRAPSLRQRCAPPGGPEGRCPSEHHRRATPRVRPLQTQDPLFPTPCWRPGGCRRPAKGLGDSAASEGLISSGSTDIQSDSPAVVVQWFGLCPPSPPLRQAQGRLSDCVRTFKFFPFSQLI